MKTIFSAILVSLLLVFGTGCTSLTSPEERTPPQVAFQVPPVYPIELRRQGITGEVLISFSVDKQGNTRDISVITSSHPAFEPAAIASVAKWKFRPGQVRGSAVTTRNMRVPIFFRIQAEKRN